MPNNHYIEIEGHPGLVRDTKTNAIINVDFKAIEQSRQRRKLLLDKRKTESQLKNRITQLENDMSFLKSAMEELLERYK